MVRVRRIFATILLTVALALAGCSRSAPSAALPEAQARQEVISAVVGYMEGRKVNDLAGAYKHLSGPVRGLYTEAEFTTYYGKFKTMEWGRVGSVVFIAPNWARVVVFDIVVTNNDGIRQQIPDFPYYVQKTDGTWGVALINPMFERLDKLASDRQKVGELTQSLLKVNPYSSALQRQLYYLAAEQGDSEKAQEALRLMYQVISPSDLATVQVMRADFYANTGRGAQAVASLGAALKLGEAYPEIYDARWRSVVLTTKAQTHMGLGERALARTALEQAITLDPKNTDARLLLDQWERAKS